MMPGFTVLTETRERGPPISLSVAIRSLRTKNPRAWEALSVDSPNTWIATIEARACRMRAMAASLSSPESWLLKVAAHAASVITTLISLDHFISHLSICKASLCRKVLDATRPRTVVFRGGFYENEL